MTIPSEKRRRGSLARALACLAAAAVVGVVAACSSDPVDQSASLTGTETTSSPFCRPSPFDAPEREHVTLGEADAVIDDRIEVPDDSITGGVRDAVLISASEGPRGSGIALEFECGAILLCGPIDETSAAPDYQALLASEEAAGVVFTDGREHPGEVRVINGHEAWVRPGGVQYFPSGALKGTSYSVPSVVMWYDDGIEYLLESDMLSVEELVKIAAAMK